MSEPPAPTWRPPSLETPRLLLRAVTEHDVASIFAYASNPAVTRYTLWEQHRSSAGTLEFVRHAIAQYVEKTPDPLAICQKAAPQTVIGTIGCRWANRVNQCMEMGYALGEPFWGQGIVAEAGHAVLDFVFTHYAVERVQAHTFAENAASARVLLKMGMTPEGTCRSALFHRERFWDLRLFSILRADWKVRQTQ